MKWYWIVLIVIVAIAIGFIVAKAMKPKVTVVGGVKTTTTPKVDTPVKIETGTDATGKKMVVAVGK
jgi:Na+/H+-dicarboxylate symporter